jgi:hypothetical protein
MSTFEELLALDRPFVPVTFFLNGKEINLKARRPSAADMDTLDAIHSDTWARLVIEKTEATPGKQSELEKVRVTYSLRTREELIEQLLGTRYMDIDARAVEIVGKSLDTFTQEALEIENEDERVEYLVAGKKQLDEAAEIARKEIAEDYNSRPTEDLVDLISQVNINMKALAEASLAREAARLYYLVYTEDETTPFFPDTQAVLKLQVETVKAFAQAVERAFVKSVPADLPFDSPSDPEPSGPQPSPKSSEAVSKGSGKRTTRRQKS